MLAKLAVRNVEHLSQRVSSARYVSAILCTNVVMNVSPWRRAVAVDL